MQSDNLPSSPVIIKYESAHYVHSLIAGPVQAPHPVIHSVQVASPVAVFD